MSSLFIPANKLSTKMNLYFGTILTLWSFLSNCLALPDVSINLISKYQNKITMVMIMTKM